MKLFPSSVDLCMTNIKCTQLGYSRITQNNYHRFSLNELMSLLQIRLADFAN